MREEKQRLPGLQGTEIKNTAPSIVVMVSFASSRREFNQC
jgi:hypothetical protein